MYAVAKRVTDVVLGGGLLLVLAPLAALAALAIRVGDGGPVLHWQTRVGQGGIPFPFPKLRTMVVDAEKWERPAPGKREHDPRVTPLGRILRRSSIDEIPQLWSVLRGEMSLVGPRPPLPEEVTGYTPEQMRRLSVKPGLTGLWQVSGRSRLSFEEQVALDLEYVARRSLALDALILLRTVPAVLSGRGAW